MFNEHPTPTLVPAIDRAKEALIELSALLKDPQASLVDFLSAIAFDGGAHLLANEITALPVFRTNLTSGYNYAYENKMLAYVRFGVTDSNYFVVQALLLDGVSSWVSHYYSTDGKYAFSEGALSHFFLMKGETLLETECPILNHLYNILSEEYGRAGFSQINSHMVHTIERVLRHIQKTNGKKLSISKGIHDPAIRAMNDRLMAIELDPVYHWKERRGLYKQIKNERHTLIQTKKRAHKKSFWHYTVPLFFFDFQASLQRFAKRPYNNFLGLLETLLVDPFRWFYGIVRSNLGLSVAMAIYSPFTYFFITQPMNPHAMSVVGVVRSAYLETSDRVSGVFGPTVTTTVAAVKAFSGSDYHSVKPANSSMLVSSDVPEVENQSWDDRMSNFKAMQIAYEENMEVAPRLGRLEQMETQMNWPLIVESAWLETERYAELLNFYSFNIQLYTPEFAKFVAAEKTRTEQVELYIWDRNVRFILDHPFTMMDESGEQTQMDYYVGRSFVMLKDMTSTLALKHQGLPMPAGYDKIMKLAQKFENEYHQEGSVLDRLKANSKLFGQKDVQSTDELRKYMKRQWEVLYLLQNHAQEAANFGLAVYNWSVRNAIYSIQSLYSTKRDELVMIGSNFKKGATVNKLSNNPNFTRLDSQYEAVFHMMVLEYTSVRKELGESLKKDIEAIQRKEIIDGIESFLKERDSLLRGANLI